MINRDRIGHLRPDLLANGLQDEAGSILERMIAQPESRIEHAHHDREQFLFLFRHHVGAELLAEDIGEVAERVVQVFGGLLFFC